MSLYSMRKKNAFQLWICNVPMHGTRFRRVQLNEFIFGIKTFGRHCDLFEIDYSNETSSGREILWESANYIDLCGNVEGIRDIINRKIEKMLEKNEKKGKNEKKRKKRRKTKKPKKITKIPHIASKTKTAQPKRA